VESAMLAPEQPNLAERRLSRRRLLETAAAAMTTGSLFGCARARPPRRQAPEFGSRIVTLEWWGEQQAPGIENWVVDTCQRFLSLSGVGVGPTLLKGDPLDPATPAEVA